MKIADIKVDLIGHYGSDLTIVNAARVSFHKESDLDFSTSGDPDLGKLRDKDVKLINYLANHKHFSPFNHAFLSFRVKAPIFVARQLVKHKFMPWNEVSRRYVDEEPEFYWPEKWRAKAENVKQGSSDESAEYMKELQWNGRDDLTSADESVEDLVTRCLNGSIAWYKDMIDNGVSPEQARMILPQNMMTEWWWSGTLGAYLDMLTLRLDPHTQYESRIVAQKIAVTVKELFPISYAARLPEYV